MKLKLFNATLLAAAIGMSSGAAMAAAHPNSTFRYTMNSLLDLMRFDAASNMDLINQPLLMPEFSFAAQGNSERSSEPSKSGTRKLGKLEVSSIGLGVQLLTKTSGERIIQLSDKNNQRLNCVGCF